jgi:PGM1 C-terminal domain
LFALTTLADGVYDPLAAEYRTRYGDIKHYAATDHLDSPAYRSLTPDDLLDVVAERGLGWDTDRETGIVPHMISAIAVAGRIGLTAIGDTLEEARSLYYQVKAALDHAVAQM